MVKRSQLEQLAREQFGLRFSSPVEVLSAGHINRSAVVRTETGRVVLQELNTRIFAEPAKLMNNAVAVVARMSEAKLATLTFIPSVDGDWLAKLDGVPWRCHRYVEGSATRPIVSPEEAQGTARAFGRFAATIEDLDLAEHVVGYHDFDARISVLEADLAADELDRLSRCKVTVDQLLRMVDRLRLSPSYEAWSDLPVRNVHNDAKGPNCVVDATGVRTVIDLDTTMPGTILSDVGELVRSSTRSLDEFAPEAVMAQIEAVNRGFLAGYGRDLTDAERSGMLLAGPLLTVENAARFLADHLSGDKYYGAQSPDQNLDRAVVQLRLAEHQVAAIEWATKS